MLWNLEHSVIEAVDGQVVVKFKYAKQFDVIFMNINIPIMDGRAATRTIRTEFGASAYFSIIRLTAYVLASERAAFLTDGMDAVISKPVTHYALANFIHKVTSMETSKPVY